MMLKTLVLFLLSAPILFARFQSISIGTIAPEYRDRITREDIYATLLPIQQQFRSQLGYDVFAYADDGKPINIVYMKPSAKKKKILKLQEELSKRKQKLALLESQITLSNDKLLKEQNLFNEKLSQHNQRVKNLDHYIEKINMLTKKGISKEEYKKAKAYVKKEKRALDIQRHNIKKERKVLLQKLAKLNHQIDHYNQLIRKYNTLQRETERLSKNFIEVKGVTKSQIETTRTITLKNGQKSVKTTKETSMDKIEIYDFETLDEFKVVLAHELGHLVGVEHVQAKGALMNPLIQKEQIKHLFLTPADIQAFDKAFQRKK